MSELLSIMLVTVSLGGAYLFALRLLGLAVPLESASSIFGVEKAGGYLFLFLSFVAWALANGLCALVPVWGYFANMPFFMVTIVNGIAGVGFLTVGWSAIGQHQALSVFHDHRPFDLKERTIIGVILCLGLIYLYRASLPWSDHDETAVYGYFSKLIAGGRTFADILREDGPVWFTRSHLVQSWDAQLYGLVQDTYLIRIHRLADLCWGGVGIFAFLRLVGVRRAWALLAIALFLATPELSYLALSLKVDAVVMMFELAAFLSLVTAFLFYGAGRDSQADRRVPVYLSLAAIALAAFAFGNRFSGVIPMVLCAGCGIFFLASMTRKPLVSVVTIILLLALCAFVAAPGYWVSIALYGNPTYPVKCCWPFQHGAYTYTVDYFTSLWNIVGIAPGLLQAYLFFALTFGLELLAKAWPWLNGLPMAAIRTESMGWPYPLLLCLLAWPVLRKGHRALDIVVSVFLFQFMAWSLGMHYSRLLVASATLMTIAGVMMASRPVVCPDTTRLFIQKCLKVWLVVSLAASMLLQVWWTHKRSFGPLLIGASARHEARARFLDTKEYGQDRALAPDEIRQLEDIFFRDAPRPVVYVLGRGDALVQIFFDARIYVRPFDPKTAHVPGVKYLLLAPDDEAKPRADVATARRMFPREVLVTPTTGWRLLAVR